MKRKLITAVFTLASLAAFGNPFIGRWSIESINLKMEVFFHADGLMETNMRTLNNNWVPGAYPQKHNYSYDEDTLTLHGYLEGRDMVLEYRWLDDGGFDSTLVYDRDRDGEMTEEQIEDFTRVMVFTGRRK